MPFETRNQRWLIFSYDTLVTLSKPIFPKPNQSFFVPKPNVEKTSSPGPDESRLKPHDLEANKLKQSSEFSTDLFVFSRASAKYLSGLRQATELKPKAHTFTQLY